MTTKREPRPATPALMSESGRRVFNRSTRTKALPSASADSGHYPCACHARWNAGLASSELYERAGDWRRPVLPFRMRSTSTAMIDTPHGIALDSAGRVYVADRVNGLPVDLRQLGRVHYCVRAMMRERSHTATRASPPQGGAQAESFGRP